MFTGWIQLYFMSIFGAWIARFYKHYLSRSEKGGRFQRKDWEFIFIPLLNTVVMFFGWWLFLLDMLGWFLDRYDIK